MTSGDPIVIDLRPFCRAYSGIQSRGRRGDRADAEARMRVAIAPHIAFWFRTCIEHKQLPTPAGVPNRHNLRGLKARARREAPNGR